MVKPIGTVDLSSLIPPLRLETKGMFLSTLAGDGVAMAVEQGMDSQVLRASRAGMRADIVRVLTAALEVTVETQENRPMAKSVATAES
jgi:hypothetical protein